ncbi:TPA: hypothetical protein ACFJ1E_000655, partial [Neisseria gonorrhoeae]
RQSRYGRSQQNLENRTDRLIARISDKTPSEARIAGSDGIFNVPISNRQGQHGFDTPKQVLPINGFRLRPIGQNAV